MYRLSTMGEGRAMRCGLLLIVLLPVLAACGSTPAAPTAVAVTADAALTALKTAGPPPRETPVYTAATDPNKLLGRPNQYVARVAWHDTRLPAPADPAAIGTSDGGGLELFTTADDAAARVKYI